MTRCNCENERCDHEPSRCDEPAGGGRVMDLGSVCNACLDRYDPEYRLPAKPVCPNCGQWQHSVRRDATYFSDCFNACARRGFAPIASVKVEYVPGFATAPRYCCNICRKPIGFPPPDSTGWTCEEDNGLPRVMQTNDRLFWMTDQEVNELHELWRTARIAAPSAGRHMWTATEYAKAHPEQGSPDAIYKVMERLGIGELVITPEQQRLHDGRERMKLR